MTHAITIGDVLCVVGSIIGLIVIVSGIFSYMAGAASPTGDSRYAKSGCALFVGGAAIFGLCLSALL